MYSIISNNGNAYICQASGFINVIAKQKMPSSTDTP